MRLIIALSMIAVSIVITAPVDAQEWQHYQAPRQWHETSFQGDWWVEVGSAAFDRPSENLNLPLVTNSVSNEVLFTAQDLTDLETSFGTNVAFGGVGQRGRLWEVETSLVDWDEHHNIVGPNLDSPFFADGLTPDSLDVFYDSDMASIEFSTKRNIGRGITMSLGPRYYRLEENLRMETQTQVGGFQFQTENRVDSKNSAVGLQLGTQFNIPLSNSIYVKGYGKFGGFTNRTKVTQFQVDNLGGAATVDSLSKSTGMFVGEVGGKMYFEIVPRAIQTFVGYEATWVDGVALSPAQAISFGDLVPNVETTNTMFYHQITFGFAITR